MSTGTYRVVSDGTSIGTKVYDETGKEVRGIKHVSWSIDAKDEESFVVLVFSKAILEIIARDPIVVQDAL